MSACMCLGVRVHVCVLVCTHMDLHVEVNVSCLSQLFIMFVFLN